MQCKWRISKLALVAIEATLNQAKPSKSFWSSAEHGSAHLGFCGAVSDASSSSKFEMSTFDLTIGTYLGLVDGMASGSAQE